MGVHYIYDTEGRKTGVIVPIDLWESWTPKNLLVNYPAREHGVVRPFFLSILPEKIRDTIIGILWEKKAYLEETYHVGSIGIFGSCRRGEEHEGSDVDNPGRVLRGAGEVA